MEIHPSKAIAKKLKRQKCLYYPVRGYVVFWENVVNFLLPIVFMLHIFQNNYLLCLNNPHYGFLGF